MKKIIFALIIVIMWTLPLSAEIYNSQFGFSIDIPSHWLNTSKEKEQIESFINTKTSIPLFKDNIVILKSTDRLPQTSSELKQYCEKITQNLSEAHGKPFKAYKCEFRKVAGFNRVYLIIDGVKNETKTIMYLLQQSPSDVIAIAAGCRNETCETITKEFDEIMASFTFHVAQKEKEAVPKPKALKGTAKCRGLNVTIVGTEGKDSINGTPGNDVIHGLGGDDLIIGQGGDDTICGGNGDDHLIGGDGNDRLDGGDGDDGLYGDNDDDELYGGAGNDHLFGGYGNDRLFGGEGNDLLYGDNDDDELYGGAGDDHLNGGYGKDRLDGGDGKDRLDGGLGQDVCSGESDPGRRERCETIENP
jgi:hypothetical protein